MNSTSLARLGYGEWVYPYFYQPLDMEEPTGFMAELWKYISPNHAYIQYPYEEGEDLPCDSILKEVYDGGILTAADTSTLTVLRTSAFRSTLPAYYTSFVVAEAERSLEEFSPSLTFFTVFTVPAFLLIMALTFVSQVIEKLRAIHKLKVRLDNLYFTSKLICSIGFTCVFFFYIASFNGNTITEFRVKQTTLDELKIDLKSGKRSFLFTTPDVLSQSERFDLFGNVSYSQEIEPDIMKLLQMICDDRAKVTIVEAQNLQFTHLLERPCRIRSIALPENKPPRFRKIGFVYLFSFKTPRKTTERVNQALLRIYQRERVETFWTLRFVRSLKFSRAQSLEKIGAVDCIPMSLMRLRLILIVTGCGCLLSVVALIVELVVFYRIRIMKIIR